MSQQIRKGRSLNIGFTIAVQSADQVPSEILNNLNSRIILRHNNAGQARSALEKATPEQLSSTAYFGPGQALVDLFGSNAVVQGQMMRSPFQLTVDNLFEEEE
jgi:DNA helicase HerA-like ATPase